MEKHRELESLNISSVICETCGTPVESNTEAHHENENCPDCSRYWVKEQLLRHFY